MANYLSDTGLAHLWNNVIKPLFATKVDKVTGKGLSTLDFTQTHVNQIGAVQDAATALGSTKVDKIGGKGLSTNDFTTVYKDLVDQNAADITAKTMPNGGTSRQALVKSSTTDYATEWSAVQLQYEVMPTEAVGILGLIAQYIGATNDDFTKGYVYECVSSGGETPVYSWIQVTGAKGDSGVYVGDTEPTNPDDNVWVDLSENTTVGEAHTATLPNSGWSGTGPYTYTASVTGITTDNVIVAGPAPTSKSAYEDCGAYPSAQGAGTLTFTAESVPTSEITVNILVLNL